MVSRASADTHTVLPPSICRLCSWGTDQDHTVGTVHLEKARPLFRPPKMQQGGTKAFLSLIQGNAVMVGKIEEPPPVR